MTPEEIMHFHGIWVKLWQNIFQNQAKTRNMHFSRLPNFSTTYIVSTVIWYTRLFGTRLFGTRHINIYCRRNIFPTTRIGYFWIFLGYFWSNIGLKMIFRPRSSFWQSFSPFRFIWTHFTSFYIIFLKITLPKILYSIINSYNNTQIKHLTHIIILLYSYIWYLCNETYTCNPFGRYSGVSRPGNCTI